MSKKLKNITVRMYRTGFGDCFLLFFNYDKKEDTKHLLIDFGAWKPEEFLKEKGAKFHSLEQIGESIRKTLNGKALDAVVITHEHKDHLNGFKKAEKSFRNATQTDNKRIAISEIWMSWIENLSDDEARKLKDFKKSSQNAIQKAMNELSSLGVDSNRVDLLGELLSFEDGDEKLNLSNRIGQNQSAIKVVKDACDKKPVYLHPGKVIDTWEGVNFYVLGPPKDEMALYTDVSKKEGDLYLSASTLSEDEYSFMNAHFDNNINTEKWIKNAPFDEEFIVTDYQLDKSFLKNIRTHIDIIKNDLKKINPNIDLEPNFEEQIFTYLKKFEPNLTELMFKYVMETNNWRTIQADWLGTAERLAIKLNSHTNNTSLVLAIELIDADVVLLFPGDAQFGNWQSWGKVEFKVKDQNQQEKIIKTDHLLEKTVLYKAGHHASHNATAKNVGLEKMKNSLKVTLIPVARKTADSNDWPIPHQKLLDRMESIPNHGIIMSDFTQTERAKFEKQMANHKDLMECAFDTNNMFIDIIIYNKK
ncbi:MAG: hypothetical protein MUF58_23460 [Arcicella sp.]|nr:hypothetical protein [Arcicella sp.]